MFQLKSLLKHESAVGILLILAMMIAMAMANTSLQHFYAVFLNIPIVVSIGELVIAKPMLLWINDGLMAIFFFMVGMEIKREVTEGSLKTPAATIVPAAGALGGMLIPALIYLAFNANDVMSAKGWAIPMATDIAFALGILSLLGKRVPASLKIFLLALAVIDDLGAIIVIALFYAGDIAIESLAIANAIALILLIMNLRGANNGTFYIILGIFMWIAVLKSGVHATIAGVILGLLMPLRGNEANFHALERSLHAPVNFLILPLFAFVNTGIGFGGISTKDLMDSVTLGIVFGLFLGKQVGVFLFSLLAIKLRLGELPKDVNFAMLYGVSLLSGIGFTMSLFIGSLAFESGAKIDIADERLGILIGSFLSATIGYLFLKSTFRRSSL